MLVENIGNVTQVSTAYIFTNDNGKQDRIPITKENIQSVLSVCKENMPFYKRMMNEVLEEYNKRDVEIKAKYHYVTDEELEDIKQKDGKKAWFYASLSRDSKNEEWLRKTSEVHGFFSGFNYAMDRYYEAERILKQAEDVIRVKGL